MDNRPIGIFDSGLGGLTCAKKVMEIMPGEDIIYFGDIGRVPYGTKSTEIIKRYARQDIRFLQTFDIKFIIIACGTASSAVLPKIQDEFDMEIAGVLTPTCLCASKLTNNRKIGVIGTPGTIKSGKYVRGLKEIDPKTEVYSRACPMFVPLVENGYTSGDVVKIITREYLMPLKEAGIDTLILGCTHYPLLHDEIQSFMGDNVRLVNAGAETAIYVKKRLEEADMLCSRKKGSVQYYVSDTTEGFTELAGVFLERHIDGSVHSVDIEKY